jgi:hypothetical protein
VPITVGAGDRLYIASRPPAYPSLVVDLPHFLPRCSILSMTDLKEPFHRKIQLSPHDSHVLVVLSPAWERKWKETPSNLQMQQTATEQFLHKVTSRCPQYVISATGGGFRECLAHCNFLQTLRPGKKG